MSQERLYHVLVGIHISEKATIVVKDNQYIFKVTTDATKHEIKKAIEMLFEVVVDAVRTLNVKGKRKTFARRLGKRNDWKKAYVSLAEGYSIDVSSE